MRRWDLQLLELSYPLQVGGKLEHAPHTPHKSALLPLPSQTVPQKELQNNLRKEVRAAQPCS